MKTTAEINRELESSKMVKISHRVLIQLKNNIIEKGFKYSEELREKIRHLNSEQLMSSGLMKQALQEGNIQYEVYWDLINVTILDELEQKINNKSNGCIIEDMGAWVDKQMITTYLR